MLLTFAGILGFISVAFGAYAEHGLRSSLTPTQFESIMTAVRTHQIHSVLLAAIGLLSLLKSPISQSPFLRSSGILLIVGMFLFSGSIYLSYTLGIPELKKAAPWGGICLMLGWLTLAGVGLK